MKAASFLPGITELHEDNMHMGPGEGNTKDHHTILVHWEDIGVGRQWGYMNMWIGRVA